MIAPDQILDAAEHLLRSGKAEFSMRELAGQAKVSFATPFNHFGSKAAVMQALSARRIALMDRRFAEADVPASVGARVLLAVDIAAAVMVEEPAINRAVMGAIGASSNPPASVHARSEALWAAAIGRGQGLTDTKRGVALRVLPGQLAITFRGALSFWTAGEFTDSELGGQARCGAAVLLLGFVDGNDREELLSIIDRCASN